MAVMNGSGVRARRRLIGFASIVLLGALAGCTGLMSLFSPVPAAGIKYLKSLPQGAFQDAHPKDVRVAINLPAGIVLEHPVMHVDADKQLPGEETRPKKLKARVKLHQVPRAEAFPDTLSGGSGRWTYYALTPESRSGFRKLQAFIPRANPEDGNGPRMTLKLRLDSKLQMADCNRAGSVPLRVEILLDPQRGYVTVWDHSLSLASLGAPKDRVCPSTTD